MIIYIMIKYEYINNMNHMYWFIVWLIFNMCKYIYNIDKLYQQCNKSNDIDDDFEYTIQTVRCLSDNTYHLRLTTHR